MTDVEIFIFGILIGLCIANVFARIYVKIKQRQINKIETGKQFHCRVMHFMATNKDPMFRVDVPFRMIIMGFDTGEQADRTRNKIVELFAWEYLEYELLTVNSGKVVITVRNSPNQPETQFYKAMLQTHEIYLREKLAKYRKEADGE